MGMYNFLSRKKVVEPEFVDSTVPAEPVVHELSPTLTAANIRPPRRPAVIDKLKFVVAEEKWIGIVSKMDCPDGSVEVAFVDDLGDTVMLQNVRPGNLRLAKFSEIPEKRKIGITPEYAAVLGYL